MTKTHPFNHLGSGPYNVVGFFALVLPSEANGGRNNFHLAPKNLKSGCGTCAHCGTGIINNYIVSNGIGERFAIGSDCVSKCDAKEIENLSEFKRMQKKIRSKQAKERREKQAIDMRIECEELVKNNAACIGKGMDYCEWYLKSVHTLGGYKIFKKKLIDWGCK